MTKEELKKEADKYAGKYVVGYATPDLDSDFRANMFEASKEGYLAGAEPREKRITDLEIQIEKMKEKHKQNELGLIISNSSARAELEKENTELKARLQKKINTTTVSDYPYSALKLEEAKDIINCLVHLGEFNENTAEEYLNYQVHDTLKRAEQFLKELEVREDRLCEYCDQYKSCPDGKRCHTCDNGSKWKREVENDRL